MLQTRQYVTEIESLFRNLDYCHRHMTRSMRLVRTMCHSKLSRMEWAALAENPIAPDSRVNILRNYTARCRNSIINFAVNTGSFLYC